MSKMKARPKINKKGYKARPKNKQEMGSFSGVIKKKLIMAEKKPRVEFEFVSLEGVLYKTGDGRLKIDQTGGVSFLVKGEVYWKTIKGNLKWIKIRK